MTKWANWISRFTNMSRESKLGCTTRFGLLQLSQISKSMAPLAWLMVSVIEQYWQDVAKLNSSLDNFVGIKLPGWILHSRLMFTVKFVLKSLLTGDAIWRQNSWPTLIQVMTCRLTPTNHYLHHVDYLSVTSCDIQLRAVWYGMRKGFALEMVCVIYVPLILHILYWNCSVGRISFILRCNTVISACFHLQVTSSLYVLCNVPVAHNADDLKWLR